MSEIWMEQAKNAWDIEFKTPRQYVDAKLKMLRNDMYIQPTPKEVFHLRELKTEGEINRAVASIIDRHWG